MYCNEKIFLHNLTRFDRKNAGLVLASDMLVFLGRALKAVLDHRDTGGNRKKEKDILRLKALYEKLQNYMDHPWMLKHRPFHVVGDVYFVGNNYVSSFLIDGERTACC